MGKAGSHGDKLYRLVLGEGGAGDPRVIEFAASGAQAALFLAARHCAGRKVEVFENGRPLGGIRSEAGGGYWVITPPRPAPNAAGARAGTMRSVKQTMHLAS